jgi:1,2-diacylglycerol 3-beta-glucosyltransferase
VTVPPEFAAGLHWAVAAWMLLYFALMGFLALGLRRLPRSVRLDDARCPPVTAIVSARNEEADLPACIASLLALDYPTDKLRIVLVDDHSTDATGKIIDDAAAAHPNVVALHTAALPPNGLKAKARGLAHGFTRATGEWAFITDADATVPSLWIRNLLGRATERTGMVGGAQAVEPHGAVATVESMMQAYTQFFSQGFAGWNAPFACLGPNMAIRRSTYLAAGGLERAAFHVAEDLALFNMVGPQGMEVQCYLDAETSVMLRPVPSARHLFSQQRRWLAGGIGQGLEYQIVLVVALGWGFGLSLYLLLGWMLGLTWWLAFVATKALVDAAMLAAQQRRLALADLARHFPVLELYHVFIFAALPATFLFNRKVRWMGDGFADTFR